VFGFGRRARVVGFFIRAGAAALREAERDPVVAPRDRDAGDLKPLAQPANERLRHFDIARIPLRGRHQLLRPRPALHGVDH
jgi:hypothetical protein